MAGNGVAERAFAGAVGAHQGVDFATVNFEIHTFEDRLATDGHMQVGDAEGFGHFWIVKSDHVTS